MELYVLIGTGSNSASFFTRGTIRAMPILRWNMCALFLSLSLWTMTALCAPPKLPLTQTDPSTKGDASIVLDERFLYCDAYSRADEEWIRALLQSGAIVSSSWQISIKRPRPFWFDRDIREVEVIRQITPDMLTGSWRLLDVKTKRRRITHNLAEAMAFLLRLDHLPIIERQKLADIDTREGKGEFIFHVRIHVRDGTISTSPWSYPFRLGKTLKKNTFHLP